MPAYRQFVDTTTSSAAESYYATLLHELIKAVNAAYLAMARDGTHHVSLDQVVETMRQTGLDMLDKYRETSRGGVAVNVPEC